MMRVRLWIPPLLAGVALGGMVAAGAEGTGPTDRLHIDKLIHQLGSPRFAERQAASKQLDAIGAPALKALQKATADNEPEKRRRAAELIARIEGRRQTERILQPTRLRLVCKATPLPDAVAELARKSGHAVVAAPDIAKARERTVTLDTGETTFWQALDQLCHTAGLEEDNQSEVSLYVEQARPLRRLGVMPLPPRLVASKPGPIILKEGKPQERPVCYAGAARIRLLPVGTPILGSPRQEGEIVLVLEASLEPHALLEHATGTRIEKAIDDQGQQLVQSLPSDPAAPFGEPIFLADRNGLARALLGPGAQQVAVRLTAGPKPARFIKELKGWVAVDVRTPPEPLLAVDDILDASEKTVQGPQGASVTVTEVEKLEDGQISIRVDLQPAAVNANNLFSLAPRWRFQAQGGQPQIEPAGGAVIGPAGGVIANPMGLSLVDDKGRSFQLVSVPRRRFAIVNNTVTHDLTLLFKPGEGQGQPAKLVYSTMRVLTVEIPFSLKDIPVP